MAEPAIWNPKDCCCGGISNVRTISEEEFETTSSDGIYQNIGNLPCRYFKSKKPGVEYVISSTAPILSISEFYLKTGDDYFDYRTLTAYGTGGATIFDFYTSGIFERSKTNPPPCACEVGSTAYFPGTANASFQFPAYSQYYFLDDGGSVTETTLYTKDLNNSAPGCEIISPGPAFLQICPQLFYLIAFKLVCKNPGQEDARVEIWASSSGPNYTTSKKVSDDILEPGVGTKVITSGQVAVVWENQALRPMPIYGTWNPGWADLAKYNGALYSGSVNFNVTFNVESKPDCDPQA